MSLLPTPSVLQVILSSVPFDEVNDVSSFPDSEAVIVHGDSDSQKLLAVRLADTLGQATGKRPEVGTLRSIQLRSFASSSQSSTNLFSRLSPLLNLQHYRRF